MRKLRRHALLATAGLLVCAGAPSTASAEEVVRITIHPTDSFYVDNDPSGQSAGDLFGSTGELIANHNIGTYTSACTGTSSNGGQCQATLNWDGRGRLQIGGGFEFNRSLNRVPILGGTGEFKTARGFALLSQLPNSADQRAELHIFA
jgi:hypothetical protein